MLPVLLDISRSVSRAGRSAPTGIDRVEDAYWNHFGNRDCRFLARVPGGVFLLDRPAGQELRRFLAGKAGLPPPDLRARITPHRPHAVRQAESFVRRAGTRFRSGERRPDFIYINVGHSNLDLQGLTRLRAIGCVLIAVMIHDTIPLDHPEFASRGSTAAFARKLPAFADSDLLICNSLYTAARARHWLGPRTPSTLLAHLGIDPVPAPDRAPAVPPRFLVLGTIEPRKNHALLLEVWRGFGRRLPPESIPHLDVVGARGWRNREVFRQLSRDPFIRRFVHELGPLADAELSPLMRQATALLFPSLAEGFGLPVAEARQARLPVVCSDLPVLREAGGAGPLYLAPDDPHSWSRAILDTKGLKEQAINPEEVPRWDRHFVLVEAEISALLKP